LEAVTALAAAAVCTRQARLGSSVFILGHRHPVLMAKMLASIDALSNGRLICGVGAGWWKEELEILGTPFDARGRRGDEALHVFKELWTSYAPRFEGDTVRFGNLGFSPRPVQKPHPPIWIGGREPGCVSSGRHAGRRLARLAAQRRPVPRGADPAPRRSRQARPCLGDARDLAALRPER